MVNTMSGSFWSSEKCALQETILQYPNIKKPYTLFTDASNCFLWCSHSGSWWSWWSEVQESGDIIVLSPTHSKNGLQLKKKLLQFTSLFWNLNLFLWGAQCILHSNDRPLEPFCHVAWKYISLIIGQWNYQIST